MQGPRPGSGPRQTASHDRFTHKTHNTVSSSFCGVSGGLRARVSPGKKSTCGSSVLTPLPPPSPLSHPLTPHPPPPPSLHISLTTFSPSSSLTHLLTPLPPLSLLSHLIHPSPTPLHSSFTPLPPPFTPHSPLSHPPSLLIHPSPTPLHSSFTPLPPPFTQPTSLSLHWLDYHGHYRLLLLIVLVNQVLSLRERERWCLIHK